MRAPASLPPIPRAMLYPASLVFLECVLYLSQDMALPALPALQADYRIGTALSQMSFTAWIVGAAALQLPVGPMSDRFGRRVVLLGGCAMFVAAALGCALRPPWPLFMACRVLQGAALSCVLVAGYACIHETLDTRQAIRTQSWMSGISVLAPAAGPALGALVLAFAPWRVIFSLLALAAVLAFALLHATMPETVDRARSAALSVRASARGYGQLLLGGRFLPPLLVCALLLGVLTAWNVTSPFLLLQAFGSTSAFAVAQAYLFGLYIHGTRRVRRHLDRVTPEVLARRALRRCLLGAAATLAAALLHAPAAMLLALFGLCTQAIGELVPLLVRAALDRSHLPMGASVALMSVGINLLGIATTLTVAWLELRAAPRFFALAAALIALAWSLGRRAAPDPEPG